MKFTRARFFFALFLICSLLIISPFYAYSAQQGDASRILTHITAPSSVIKPPEEKLHIFADSYYEFSDVRQNSRSGSWREETNMAGFSKNNVRGYFSVSQLRRFDQKNYTANFGSYISFKDAYCHLETGFGWDTSYIYNLQEIVEYAHRLHKNLYWQIGYNFRFYHTGNTHLIYPGLIYYFGDSYVSADYGSSMIENRGRAGNMGTVKCNIVLNRFISWWAGGAYGEWIYDINGLPAADERGYLAFAGLTFNVNKWLSARIGYSYGAEKPKFVKKNLMYGLSVKF